MAATKHYFSGIAEWAKVYPANKDSYRGKTFYAIDLIITEEDYQRFIKTGSRHEPKREKEGFWRLKLRRNEDNKVEEYGGPPRVFTTDPNDANNYVAFDELIGNGSEVTVAVVVYDAGDFGTGTRLEAVRVDKLVSFGGTKVDTSGIDIGVPF